MTGSCDNLQYSVATDLAGDEIWNNMNTNTVMKFKNAVRL